jgi:hypothetical protein
MIGTLRAETSPKDHSGAAVASVADDATVAGVSRDPLTDELARLLEANPGMAARLLREHVDDGTGRCAACAWPQRPSPRWPCAIRWHVARASDSGTLHRLRNG